MTKVPGFVRFSLATLLLVCVFVGAVMGCWIGRNPWVREYELPAHALRSTGANGQWNDYLTFNATGEKLAIFRSHGNDLELYDLATRKSVWRKSSGTCYLHLCLNILDASGRLLVGDYVSSSNHPYVSRCHLLSNGKDDFNYPVGQSEEFPIRNSIARIRLGEILTSSNWLQYSAIPTVFETAKHDYRLKDSSPDGKEWAVPSPDIEKPPQSVCKIFSASGSAIEIHTEKPVVAARYSEDGKLLALMDDQGVVSIWKRSRYYDPRGLFAMPVFWIAVGAGIGLCFKMVRFVFGGRKRQPKLRT